MDLFSEEIDFMLYESLEADGLIFEKRKRNLEDPELMKQIIDTVGMLPSSSRKIKKKEYIKQFGGGSWPKGLGKGAFILSLNKAGEARIYDIGSPDEAQDWSESGTEAAPEDAPRVRISTELGGGDFAAYKFMGQTKTVGDPADKKALEYFKDDETIPMSAKGPELYAGLAKNYAMHSILAGKKAPDAIGDFASYLAQNIKPVFLEEVEKTKDLRKSFLVLERDLSLDLEKLKKYNKKAMKDKESSERLVNNFTTSQQLTIKLANYLMEALNLMYVEASQFLQDSEKASEEEKEEEEGEEKMKIGTEPGKVELNEDKLVEIVIDFNEIRKNEMNESFLAMFGGWVEHILKAMFGGLNIPVNVRGSDREVQAFATALGREKRYIDVAKRYGLDHASTYRSKAQLDAAAKNFQRETGIKWPFK